MIQALGVRHNVELRIREKLSIITKRIEKSLEKLKKHCDEVVILSTCNRTEIYFKSKDYDDSIIEKIFDELNWDKDLLEYTFYLKEDKAIEHLMDVVCGFDSIIFGEEQILGQVKMAYEVGLENKSIKSEFIRLFETAIACGKEFRLKTELYRIPVSSSSIVVNEAKKRGIKKFMILGYGGVGSLVAKYITSIDFEKLYIVVRDEEDLNIDDTRVKVIKFKERELYYNDVDCIISCTSAPHVVIESKNLPDKELLIFDLAVPRDVSEDVYSLPNAEVYNIDNINIINDENHDRRKSVMIKNRDIIDEYIKDFRDWQTIREITPYIIKLKGKGEDIYKKRYEVFKNKKETKDVEQLVETMIKSTSNAYINKAIETLKEEYLDGRGEECLRIIKKIFY
ncbi:glutamyl-tRNA reductase HemA [Gottschalkia acidurici 9a]|uniref:Glutamyl-tRNA reductase n=1 Tax=Gottschalkia acidurici (strain ATCC 7906 / DSM 604 / BCRC 14475 / CIP 104303 / KCTC 5404 / NCIMB 10678 / 9a) TaxID=1128398 RepID=K0B1X6_GOTA9|nr:glutamyl-tRNA reductase [Gottschalkia acidurici]AFS79464.1 glutamyl-tRNA reductase HemA [Gottschalkia acidurici 9a]